MSNSVAIEVENLSKAYQLGQIGTGTISRDLERFVVTKILRKEDPFLKIGQTNDRTVKEKEIISMVGYNLRYHPIHKRLSQIIDQGLLGNISSIRLVVGQYLPDWHPQEDYRFGYSANKNLGGGAVLDLIHEIDFVYSLFGKVNDIKSFSSKTSHLEIDVEDVAEIIMKFASGILGSVHVDYVNRRGQRDGMILGDEASVKYDLLKAELTIMYKNGIEEIEIFDFVRNKMYRNELSDLLNAISTRVELKNNFAEGLEVLSYANRALNE